MNYDDLARMVVKQVVERGESHRIVSIDLETRVLSESDFLTGETILSFAMARRVDGVVLPKLFTLGEETSQSQQTLFSETNLELERIRPLIIVGYNVTGYDFPLLRAKLRRSPTPHWALIDMVERAFVLDMKHPLKFEIARADGSSPRVRTLEDVVNHPRFSHLQFSGAKNLLRGLDKSQKGQKIYSMWKDSHPDFERYAIGDVVDVLSLYEELYQVRRAIASVRSE
jgi:hypothetical protein